MKRIAHFPPGLGQLLLLGALLLAGPRLHAASWGEQKALTLATDYLNHNDWSNAARAFGQFATNYPKSDSYSQAVLDEAQARFHLAQYPALISRLASQMPRAGGLADHYVYWIAEARFHGGNFQGAADDYDRLLRDYPSSPLRLEASVKQADALSRIGDWQAAIQILGPPERLFQQLAKASPASRFAIDGMMLLAAALESQRDYSGAARALADLGRSTLPPEDEWRRVYKLCQVQIEAGQLNDALRGSTNLVTSPAAAARPAFEARGLAMQAAILEQLGRLPEAILVSSSALATNLPAGLRRQAVLKIVELNLRRDDVAAAVQGLNSYLTDYPAEKESDLALLARSELYLRQGSQSPLGASPTNYLGLAAADLTALITNFPNSDFLGKAYLNLGWTLLLQSNMDDSAAAFSNAVARLTAPADADAAVARFKLADLQFEATNYPDAIDNYQQVVDAGALVPAVKRGLVPQALYQEMRAALAEDNLEVATSTLDSLLRDYPQTDFAGPSSLLVGEALNREANAVQARQVLSDFATRFPGSPLDPELQLAIIRTFESTGQWPEAVLRYDSWLATHTNDPSVPRAEFARAWAQSEAGTETNAFDSFTNFLARYPTNELAPYAQSWVADHYFRQGDFRNAELEFQEIPNKWSDPSLTRLADEAWMKAGLAAASLETYNDAIRIYTNLTGNPAVPPELRARAVFATADAYVLQPPDTNNPEANFNEAIRLLSQHVLGETNIPVVLQLDAQGRLGDYYSQLAALDPDSMRYYASAVTNYTSVMNSPAADVAARSEAEVGLAICLEKMGRLKPAADQSASPDDALAHLKNVIYGANLREGEKQDLYWVTQAGLNACRLLEESKQWDQLPSLCNKLDSLVPSMRPTWQRAAAKAPPAVGNVE
jgi:TolA-binding protein